MRFLSERITLRRVQVRHAITDLYDEDRRTLLIQYPVVLIVALGLAGVVAFALTGFLGYAGSATAFPFGDPVVLLPWLYAVQITLLVSIFRDPSLRWQRYVIVAVTLLAIGLLVAAALNSDELQLVIQQYLQHPGQPIQQHTDGLFQRLASNVVTYTVLNFVFLGVFWLDTARRWLRRALGQSPNPTLNLGLDDPRRYALPRIEDMVSGDLLAAGVLAIVLGVILSPGVIGRLVPESQHASLQWLSTLDIMQTLVTLPLGLIILGLAATLNGLGALGGVEAGRTHIVSNPLQSSARKAVSEEVSLTVLKTLQAALDRRVRAALGAIVLSLRNLLWPILILIATVALAVAAELLEAYLHTPSKTEMAAIVTVLLAGVLGIVAALFTVFAAALFLFSRRVATNSLRFLGLVGFIVLLTFWMFSLALSGFNLLLLSTNVTQAKPFYPPGLSTALSFLALLIYGALAIRRNMRDRQQGGGPTGDEATA